MGLSRAGAVSEETMFRKALVPLAGILLSVSAPAFAHDDDWDYRGENPHEYLHERLEDKHEAAHAYDPYMTPWEHRRLHRQLRREHRYNHWLARHGYPYYW